MDSISVQSRWGVVTLYADHEGLAALKWRAAGGDSTSNSTLLRAKEWLAAYQLGRQSRLPALKPAASDFQRRARRQLLAIQFGETKTYKQLGEELGSSPRAVGQAAKRNPLAIFVPCHRLVASDGSLGGYNGGTTLKAALLAHEGS